MDSALLIHARTNLLAAGIEETSPLYAKVVELLEVLSREDHKGVETFEVVNLFSRLGKSENLPHKAKVSQALSNPDTLPMWMRYVLEHFKREEFCELPEEMHRQSSMWKYASYDNLVSDTVHCNGTIMAAAVSLLFKPKRIVEFGTHGGMTALLLCRLNPEARIHAVDINSRMPDAMLPICCAAMMNRVKNLSVHIMNSWDFKMRGEVDFCFIDSEHVGAAPMLDSERAWENRSTNGDWCIAWDDYHPNNPDVFSAVNTFTKSVGMTLNKVGSWVWIGNRTQADMDRILLQP